MNRVYLHNGIQAHLLLNMDEHMALCGLEASFDGYWYGTGTQAEYDHAASLPLCRRCRDYGAVTVNTNGAV